MFRSNLFILSCLVLLSSAHLAHAGPLDALVVSHRTELVVTGCLVSLVLGTVAGILVPQPEGSKITNWYTKGLLSLLFGFVAFVYTIDRSQSLTLGTIISVAGVAFAAPIFAEQVRALIASIVLAVIRGNRNV